MLIRVRKKTITYKRYDKGDLEIHTAAHHQHPDGDTDQPGCDELHGSDGDAVTQSQFT